MRESKWIGRFIPLGIRKIVTEGSKYKVYVPRDIGRELEKEGIRKVMVYLEVLPIQGD